MSCYLQIRLYRGRKNDLAYPLFFFFFLGAGLPDSSHTLRLSWQGNADHLVWSLSAAGWVGLLCFAYFFAYEPATRTLVILPWEFKTLNFQGLTNQPIRKQVKMTCVLMVTKTIICCHYGYQNSYFRCSQLVSNQSLCNKLALAECPSIL